MQRPPPATNRPNRPLLFTTEANSSLSSSSGSSTNSSLASAAPTELDDDNIENWAPIQFNYLFDDTTVPNGPGTFVNLDTLPHHTISLAEWTSGFSTESRPTTPIQDNDEEPIQDNDEKPEDTGAGIGA